ncbi:MAG: ribosome-associated translation inhibitor RaiA [Candidatus Electryonea clarkiae]|nr:ribosome-associated translation inhibitor RaiA [Candidatus Electryonea clarkiae]MDP8286545.1 ribosome-associated translation inhibitor RaiA [Candidatus Electryonea clarkiae]
MKVTVEARHFKARDDLQSKIEKEIQKLEKYFPRIIDAHVILDGKQAKKEATVKLQVPEQVLVATETAVRFEVAVESAVDKLKVQLQKYKEKRYKH